MTVARAALIRGHCKERIDHKIWVKKRVKKNHFAIETRKLRWGKKCKKGTDMCNGDPSLCLTPGGNNQEIHGYKFEPFHPKTGMVGTMQSSISIKNTYCFSSIVHCSIQSSSEGIVSQRCATKGSG